MSEALVATIRQGMVDAKKLNEVTEAFNETLTRAESAIRDLRCGVAARVEVRVEGNAIDWLGFYKVENMWRLTYQRGEETRIPLVQSPRWFRLLAVPHLERLVRALLAAMEVEVKRIQDTNSKLDDLIEEIKPYAMEKKP